MLCCLSAVLDLGYFHPRNSQCVGNSSRSKHDRKVVTQVARITIYLHQKVLNNVGICNDRETWSFHFHFHFHFRPNSDKFHCIKKLM